MINEGFIELAKQKVAEYTNNNVLSEEQGTIDFSQVFVVWYSKTLQNHKALLATPVNGDRHYYEATYNGDKKQLYLDVYAKQENKCFNREAIKE